MARMAPPDGPAPYDPPSKEGYMYNALNEALPYEYTVMHSVHAYLPHHGTLKYREADFIVYHPDKGVLIIEAKAGYPYSDGYSWFYTDGKPMPHGGPYRQACDYKFGLIELEKTPEFGFGTAQTGYCKKWEVVWFYDLTDDEYEALTKPHDARRDLTITWDDMCRGLKERIDEILEVEDEDNVHAMTQRQWASYERKLLWAPCNMAPSTMPDFDVTEDVIFRLTEQQAGLLDYLRFEKRASIGGIGGSGKTVIAQKKAQRLAEDGGKVLFLCNTSKLRGRVQAQCSEFPNVTVKTVQGFATSKRCGGRSGRKWWFDYEKLAIKLLDKADEFEYDHVVIDEAQDFGGDIERSGLLLALDDCVGRKGGSMYVFHDVLQAVYSQKYPDAIDKYPCRLALYKNCRNTVPVARTALASVLSTHGYTVMEGVDGPRPTIFIDDDPNACAEHVSGTIARYVEQGIPEEDIVVLTCMNRRTSRFSKIVGYDGAENYWPGTNVHFDTVLKFKGLERKAVIVVDVDIDVWYPEPRAETFKDEDGEEYEEYFEIEPGVMLYTAATRAKRYLDITCTMDTEGLNSVLDALQFGLDEIGEPRMQKRNRRKPAKALADRLDAQLVEE